MIEYISGDILKADVEAIVNTVNCVGVMGRGIALQFKNAWPKNFDAYKTACDNKQVVPGKMFIFETGQLTNPKYIINFPTKRHWRGASRMEDIELGLQALISEVKSRKIQSIAIPPLGAGLGGLNWNDVRLKIEHAMTELSETQVLVFEPKGAPENDRMVKNKQVPKMTPGRAVLVELMQRYLSGLLDPTITLLEVHKLMYFMQEAGEELRLNYKKAFYGPYAENLTHVLRTIEGHMVSGYADGGDAPEKSLQLVPGAVDEANRFLESHPDTLERFKKVSKLVDGFESPFGLELLSSVHWLAKKEQLADTDSLIKALHNWSERKRQFTPRQIQIAQKVLVETGWLAA